VDQTDVILRGAAATDQPAIEKLLTELELPVAGVGEWISSFWVAEADGRMIGVAGLEIYDDGALLRSVAVVPDRRSSGLGRVLIEQVLHSASSSGAREVFLLTTTAQAYFPKLGFQDIPREKVPPGVRGSIEFREACPASAMVMRRGL
jgi:amino-acid N-acetyltransferase